MSDKTHAESILEERNRLITESRAVLDAADTENRGLSAEEIEADDKRQGRIAECNDILDRHRKQAEMEARAKDDFGVMALQGTAAE